MVYPYRDTTPTNPDCWYKMVTLVQRMWEHITLPINIICTILVLLPKGNSDNQGIFLLEVLWKVIATTIDTRVKTVVKFHYFLHVFCANRVTGTATVELKMYQELSIIDQDPLLLLFM